MKDRSDRDCLKNYMRLQDFSCVCLELMVETNEIDTGSKFHKNDGVPKSNRLLGDMLLHDMYRGAK